MRSMKFRQKRSSARIQAKSKSKLSLAGEGISQLATTPSKKSYLVDSPDTKSTNVRETSGKVVNSYENSSHLKKTASSLKQSSEDIKQTQMKITETLKFKPKENDIKPLKIEFESGKKKVNRKVEFSNLKIEELIYPKSHKIYYNFLENYDLRFNSNSKIDLIQSIVELAINQNFYSLKGISNKNINFWKTIKNHSYFSKVFTCFSAESLKKIWSQLSNIKNIELLFGLLNCYKEIIQEKSEIKIANLITVANKFISENKNWETFGEELELKFEISRGIDKEEVKDNKENLGQENIENDENLGKKRYRSYEDMIDPDEVFRIYDECNQEEEKENQKKQNKTECLNEIIMDLKEYFKDNYTEDFILEALNVNSMDIQKTYDFLKNPNLNKSHIFTQYEDNIIKNLKHTKQYNELVDIRGYEMVSQREKYLRNQ